MTTPRPLSLLAELHASEVLAEHGELTGDREPVDVARTAVNMGVKVMWADLESDTTDSFLFCPAGSQPEITVNENSPYALRRFSTAHQLGHLVYVREGGTMLGSGFLDEKGAFTDEKLIEYAENGEDDAVEQYANSFAAALLLPRAIIQHIPNAEIRSEKTANTFSVSIGTLVYREQMLKQHKSILF